MTFDVVLSDSAKAFIASLSRQERQEFYHALDMLCVNPYPDGETKTYLPVPYKPGTLGFEFGQFWISYQIMRGLCIQVFAVFWSASSFNHPIG